MITMGITREDCIKQIKLRLDKAQNEELARALYHLIGEDDPLLEYRFAIVDEYPQSATKFSCYFRLGK